MSGNSNSSAPTESHSALFGLEGQKRASTTAGSGAGSGIIGASGHTGAANKLAVSDVSDNGTMQSTLAEMAVDEKSTAAPGAGSETLTPSQGTGDVQQGK